MAKGENKFMMKGNKNTSNLTEENQLKADDNEEKIKFVGMDGDTEN